MNHHDWKTCWVCQGMRLILVIGMAALALVMLSASVHSLWLHHWGVGAKEFIAVPLIAVWTWLGLKALNYLNEGFDWLFDWIEAKLQ